MTARVGVALSIVLLVVSAASAQTGVPEAGGRVYGMVGGAFGGDAAVATGAGAGLRLTSRLGLDLEIAYLSDHGDDDRFVIQSGSDVLPTIFPPIRPDHERAMTTFLARFVVEFPTSDGRVIPFLAGGGGLAHVAGRRDIRYARPFVVSGGAVGELTFAPPRVEPTSTGLALTIGGGVDVNVWRGLAVGADLRWLRVRLGFGDIDAAQITSRVSYRF